MTPPPAPTFHAFLDARRTLIAEQAAAQLASSIPFYRAMPPEDRLHAVRNLVAVFLDAVVEFRPEAIRAWGQARVLLRAGQGLSLRHTIEAASRIRTVILGHAREAARLGALDPWEGTLRIVNACDILAAVHVDFFQAGFDDTQAALRKSEENYRQVVEHAPMGVGVIREGRIVFLNEAGARMFALSHRDEALGESILRFVHPEDTAIVKQRKERLGETFDALGTREGRVVRKDGVAIDAFIGTRRITFEGAPATQFVFMDITERKLAEAALRRSAAQEEALRAQEAMLRALSSPLIPLGDGVVVMPLIGHINRERSAQIVEALASGVVEQQASMAILDVTGVPEVDAEIAEAIVRAAQAVRLLGCGVVLTGIKPGIAKALVELGVDLGGIAVRGTLRDGIREAMAQAGSAGRGLRPGRR